VATNVGQVYGIVSPALRARVKKPEGDLTVQYFAQLQ